MTDAFPITQHSASRKLKTLIQPRKITQWPDPFVVSTWLLRKVAWCQYLQLSSAPFST